MLSVQLRPKVRTDIENKRRKMNINIHTSSMQNPFLSVELQRRIWAFAPKPGNCVSDHAEELSNFIEKHARDVFGVKERKPRQPWISHGTWCTVKVIAPLRRLAHQAGECGRFGIMKRYFAAWMASKQCESARGDHLQGARR